VGEVAAAGHAEPVAQRGTAASSCWSPASSYRMARAGGRTPAVAAAAGTRCSSCAASETEGCHGAGSILHTDQAHGVAEAAAGAHCPERTIESSG